MRNQTRRDDQTSESGDRGRKGKGTAVKTAVPFPFYYLIGAQDCAASTETFLNPNSDNTF